MSRYKDQIGKSIVINSIPKRVISTVPSQSELLYDLGLDTNIIGLTKFCIHPKGWKKTKTIIGGTKNLNIKKIAALKPDFIIANKEENDKAQIEELQKICPVWTSDIKSIKDNYRLIRSMGRIFNKVREGQDWILKIKAARKNFILPSNNLSCAYIIWQKPLMATGGDTFIHNMLKEAGMTNAFAKHTRYPETNLKEINKLNTDIILLSSEPFPFKQKHVDEMIEATGLPCLLVDGEMFSWYGSRILKAYPYFHKIFNT